MTVPIRTRTQTAPLRRVKRPRAPLEAVDLRSDGARRLTNVLAAVVGILLTAPLMLCIAILIRATSPGPILFRQERVGRRRRGHPEGRPFTMLKFRTMSVAPRHHRACWATEDEGRITAVGRVLRRFRLDELPQLFNVLRGDMNVVGPRPEQPEIFDRLRRRIRRYVERQRVLPGITGWAQINQGYDRTIDDVRRKVALDLEYIRRRSTLEDLKIMWRTVPVMLGRRGAL